MCLWLTEWWKANAGNVFRNMHTDVPVAVSYTFKSPLQAQVSKSSHWHSWSGGKHSSHPIESSSCLSSPVWGTIVTAGRWGWTAPGCQEVTGGWRREMLWKKSRVKQLDVHLKRESVHLLNPFYISYISFLSVTCIQLSLPFLLQPYCSGISGTCLFDQAVHQNHVFWRSVPVYVPGSF